MGYNDGGSKTEHDQRTSGRFAKGDGRQGRRGTWAVLWNRYRSSVFARPLGMTSASSFLRLTGPGLALPVFSVSGEATPVTAGPVDFGPVVSTDGREIYFNARAEGVTRTFRVSADGGIPAAVKSRQPFGVSDVLPDGRLLGDTVLQLDDGTVRSTIALLSPNTGAVEEIPDIPHAPHPFIPDVTLRVASLPGGTGIGFVDTKDAVPNVWMKPSRAGQAKRLTNFTSDSILDFAWSKDGKLAVARGRVQHDLVLITRQ